MTQCSLQPSKECVGVIPSAHTHQKLFHIHTRRYVGNHLTVASCGLAQNWKQPKCPSIGQSIICVYIVNGNLCSNENETTTTTIIRVDLKLSTNGMKINGFATVQTLYRKETNKHQAEDNQIRKKTH